MARKIVLLEMNEVPYRVLDHFVEQHPDSALARTLPKTKQYETITTDTGDLSPWITWPSFHRGVNNELHDVMHLGQNLERVDKEYPPIWRLLLDGGISTGVFGPMHAWPMPEDFERFAFYLPDTFAPTPESHPSALTSFQNFNLVMARASARNVSGGFDLRSLLEFGLHAPGLGLRIKTLISILGQLRDERVDGWKRTRRRTFQPVVAFDLYMKQLKKQKPQFSNFFSNHVASAMHRYWAALFPEDYDVLELGEDWQERFVGEIDFAMQWFSDFFERLTQFADRNPEYIIIAASSMGQAATFGNKLDTQLYLRDVAKFMGQAGLGESDWKRRLAMDPTVSVVVEKGKVEGFEQFLRDLDIADVPTRYSAKEAGFFDLHFGQSDLDPESHFMKLRGVGIRHTDFGMEITKVEDEGGSTGYHIPEGILLTYDPTETSVKEGRTPIKATEVAPALLDHFGVEIPSYMNKSGALVL